MAEKNSSYIRILIVCNTDQYESISDSFMPIKNICFNNISSFADEPQKI